VAVPGLHPGRPVLPATISHQLARIGIATATGRVGGPAATGRGAATDGGG
jgi:hypothetical protein